MINLLIRWSLENRILVLALSAALVVAGLFVTNRLPIDVFPDLSAPTVTVIVEGHGLSPQEMELQVTYPIEAAMNGAAEVRRVRSGTAVGLSVIWVEFSWGTDILRARQTVTERLATTAGKLPTQVEAPILAPTSSVMGEILFLALRSDRHDLLELRQTATTTVRRRLLAVPGVSQVTPIGGDTKQYQVILSPELLRAYDISASEVLDVLAESNENVAGGVLPAGPREILVEGIGRVRSEADIAGTAVTVRDGVPILVSDLGVVRVGAAFKRGTAAASTRDAQGNALISPAVVFAVQKQPTANTLELTERIDEILEDIASSLPDGMLIDRNLFRQADFIETSIANTSAALLEGGLMVVLVVLLFLGSLRASLVTLAVLPISLLVAVLVLRALGSGINTMTLGGMAIAIGSLVDDAIIDVENVVRRLRQKRAAGTRTLREILDTIYAASVEVRPSIVLATLIILLVFLPLFVLDGVEGRLLRPLGVAFSVSLTASLVTALTLTPALCSFALPESRTVRGAREPRVIGLLKAAYSPLLDRFMSHPWLIGLPAVAAFVLSIVAALGLGRAFLPEFNEGALVIGVVALPGTSLEESDRLAQVAERVLMQHPEITGLARRTGRAEEDEHVQSAETSEFEVGLDMDAPARSGHPTRSKEQLLDALRKDLAAIPGIQATFGQPISHRIDHMLSGTRASVAVKIFGDDLDTLRELGGRVEETMRSIPGVVDLSAEQQALVPALRVDFDRVALARHGLHIADAARALQLGSQGIVVSKVLEGISAFDLLVRVGELDRGTSERLAETLLRTESGALVPLRAVAQLHEERSPNFISREDVQRKLVVMCNVSGRDVGGVVADVRSAIAREVALPTGYWIDYGGQFESAEATSRRLGFLTVAVILGIALMLFAVFHSVRDTLFIMLNLPLALIGGVFGLVLTDGVLSVASIIGFITVFGVAARNGIMMISHVRHLQVEEGVTDFREAVKRGALERLAPIVMTALSAGLALVPLAWRADQPGNEILGPMALVIIFGLVSSTLLNMALIPALFLRFGSSSPPEPRDAPTPSRGGVA